MMVLALILGAVRSEPGALPASLIAILVGSVVIVARRRLAQATKHSYRPLRPGAWYDRFALVAVTLFGACFVLAGAAGVVVYLVT